MDNPSAKDVVHPLLHRIFHRLNRQSMVRVFHVYHEANFVVDILTNVGLQSDQNCTPFGDPPHFLDESLYKVYRGIWEFSFWAFTLFCCTKKKG